MWCRKKKKKEIEKNPIMTTRLGIERIKVPHDVHLHTLNVWAAGAVHGKLKEQSSLTCDEIGWQLVLHFFLLVMLCSESLTQTSVQNPEERKTVFKNSKPKATVLIIEAMARD